MHHISEAVRCIRVGNMLFVLRFDSAEGVPSFRHFEDNHSIEAHIALWTIIKTHHNLGSRVCRCRLSRNCARPRIIKSGNFKIADLRQPVFIQKYVGRLQITVQNALCMDRQQAVGQRKRDDITVSSRESKFSMVAVA
jgi:hypothetical protein